MTSIKNFRGRDKGQDRAPATIVVGHATFCVVIVYNNVLARLRRSSGSVIEASMDLGASGIQTFRYVLLPSVGTVTLIPVMIAQHLAGREATNRL